MKKRQFISFLMLGLLIYPFQAYSGKERCPPEAIHCVHTLINSSAKWIKITMMPRDLKIILCLSSREVIYLEKDDIEHDGISSGDTLTWILNQCANHACDQSQLIGADQFILNQVDTQYTAKPNFYGFIFDPEFGEDCKP